MISLRGLRRFLKRKRKASLEKESEVKNLKECTDEKRNEEK